jgi:flagellar protein FlaJ
MASIAETGVSPVSMFEAIASFDEYEEVSREAASMVKQVKYLGKDLLSVLQTQSDKTPSEDFKQTLKGMVSVLHAGGNIASYFRQKYNDIMFRRILKESEYEKSLDVHENLFTTLLVVAPLLFFTFVMLGQMISPGASDAVMLLRLLTYVFMPIANIGFIMLLKLSRD